ncbi:MAG: DUF2442 domain-containing protein [Candidatus Solibacter sp.]|jgi:hypothetical protein
MKRITKISPLAGYRLTVEFEDGVTGTVELESQLFGPVFTSLRDQAVFSQVRLDEFGAPCWPNGADLAPDAIYAQLTGQPISRTATKARSSGRPKRL